MIGENFQTVLLNCKTYRYKYTPPSEYISSRLCLLETKTQVVGIEKFSLLEFDRFISFEVSTTRDLFSQFGLVTHAYTVLFHQIAKSKCVFSYEVRWNTENVSPHFHREPKRGFTGIVFRPWPPEHVVHRPHIVPQRVCKPVYWIRNDARELIHVHVCDVAW